MKNWEDEHPLILNDLNDICKDTKIPWECLDNSAVLVTGATGLIGCLVVKALMYAAEKKKLNIKVGAYVRNKHKAVKKFSRLLATNSNLVLEEGDLSKELNLSIQYDYVIHTASTTASKDFVEHPVETIATTVLGSKLLLDYCKNNQIKSCVYLSSMEVYGDLEQEEVCESDLGTLDITSVRNSYPISKRLVENLCISYFKEYEVRAKILRLTQTFGPGVDLGDNRVFAQFAKSVINSSDIVLNTTGKTKRDYLYTADAVKAILSVLLLGNSGDIYNVSNPDTYCTIYDMAKLCAELADNKIKVVFDIDENKSRVYLGEIKRKLNINKLNNINNFSKISLKEQFVRLIEFYKTLNN